MLWQQIFHFAKAGQHQIAIQEAVKSKNNDLLCEVLKIIDNPNLVFNAEYNYADWFKLSLIDELARNFLFYPDIKKR